jgi:hypothetical protein
MTPVLTSSCNRMDCQTKGEQNPTREQAVRLRRPKPNQPLSSVIGIWCASATPAMHLFRHALTEPTHVLSRTWRSEQGGDAHFEARRALLHVCSRTDGLNACC